MDPPRHIALVMDGNGRWAEARGLPRHQGHREGVKAVRRIVEYAAERGIHYVTLFAFSSENWSRPRREVSMIMKLFMVALRSEINDLNKRGVRLRFIGDRERLPKGVVREMETAERLTSTNTGLQLIVAANYGGRWEICQSVQYLAKQAVSGELDIKAIDSDQLAAHMQLPDVPDPDLVIRTGGERRISNFLLWQIAYAELYFSDVLWPDFDATSLDLALEDYANRQRRFGKTPEQIDTEPAVDSGHSVIRRHA